MTRFVLVQTLGGVMLRYILRNIHTPNLGRSKKETKLRDGTFISNNEDEELSLTTNNITSQRVV
jgi:hypothetical protein